MQSKRHDIDIQRIEFYHKNKMLWIQININFLKQGKIRPMKERGNVIIFPTYSSEKMDSTNYKK